ncbi:hypothetical protein [Planococcus shixiaomingii]|uniref:hypothetical protein n=1 Tax=Planococcus shixiaomingii TaxID=3058393 RepID=UPI00263396F7|nr:hypothetical protein [Planococcus sp. N022]WKA53439.1 hypothetical protein QWY21_12290 [Planococcus sp. N022]
MVQRLKKSELKGILQYDKKENYLLMPNEVIKILVNDEALNEKKAPHVAFAYTYLYLVTWLYRYAKYGVMNFKEITKPAIFNMMGVSETSSEFNYIIKKCGVLDRLDLTTTLSYTEAPISWSTNKEDNHGFPEFTYFKDLEKMTKEYILNGQTTKRLQIKEPLLATGFRNPLGEEEGGENYNGTFYEEGKQFTHQIGFDVFIKCMTNRDLGINAFYLYAFLRSRYGTNTDVSIALETISKESGLKPTTRDKALKMLKAYYLVFCAPEDFCLDRGNYNTNSNTYVVIEEANQWNVIPNFNFPKRKVYHVSTHVDYVNSYI